MPAETAEWLACGWGGWRRWGDWARPVPQGPPGQARGNTATYEAAETGPWAAAGRFLAAWMIRPCPAVMSPIRPS